MSCLIVSLSHAVAYAVISLSLFLCVCCSLSYMYMYMLDLSSCITHYSHLGFLSLSPPFFLPFSDTDVAVLMFIYHMYIEHFVVALDFRPPSSYHPAFFSSVPNNPNNLNNPSSSSPNSSNPSRPLFDEKDPNNPMNTALQYFLACGDLQGFQATCTPPNTGILVQDTRERDPQNTEDSRERDVLEKQSDRDDTYAGLLDLLSR